MTPHQSRRASRLLLVIEPFACLWRNWHLARSLAWREIEARYRGSALGVVWSVLAPLLMLGVYTFVFGSVLRGRWRANSNSTGEFALFVFSGLLIFSIVGDCISRAPTLMLESVSYIKRIVFPLEILPWIVLLVVLFNVVVGFAVLSVFYAVVFGWPPLTVLLLPVVIVPPMLLALGITWFLASAGVFLRDIRQIVVIAVSVLMFMSPIFYPLEAVPEQYRAVIRLNPLTPVLENSKAVLFFAQMPYWPGYAKAMVASFIIMHAGFWWFMRTRKAFADVV